MHQDVYIEVKIIMVILWVITLCILCVVINVSDKHGASNLKTDQTSQHRIQYIYIVKQDTQCGLNE